MADDVTGLEADVVVGPIGPDSLRLPGAPARLRQAVQGLHDLVTALDRTAQQLRQGGPQGDSGGKMTHALSQVAERAGEILDRDNDALRDLAGSLDHLGDVLRDAQSGTLPELRSRWHAARADLADAVESDAREGGHAGAGHAGAGHGAGPGGRVAADATAASDDAPGPRRDSHQLARHLDGQVIDDYEHLFRRWLGASFHDPGDGSAQAAAVVMGGALDVGMQRYKTTLRAILEDYADAVRRVEGADQDVASKLPRREHDVLVGQAAQDSASPASGASSPEDVQRLAEELQQAGSALQDAARSLEGIRLDVRGGRMLPPGERVGSNDGFRHDWDAHLETLRGSLDKARHHSDSVLRRLQQLEEEGAHDIRRAGRADG